MASTPRDDNRIAGLIAKSDADNTPVVLEADPLTGRLKVNATITGGGGSGGTEYQELATTSPATGTLALGRYQTSLPTLTNGQMNEPMLDSSSTLLVNSSTLATAANQTTMNSNLSSIVTNTGNSATAANQTNGNQQTKITDGTNVANVLKSDGTSAGENAMLTAGTHMSVSFTTSTAQAVATTDAGNYRSVTVTLSAVGGSSTNTFQQSDDNITWYGLNMGTADQNPTTVGQTATSTSRVYFGHLQARYFRINVTGIASGSTTGVAVFTALAMNSLFSSAQQSGTWTVGSNSALGSASPANAFYLGINNNSANLGGVISASRLANTGSNNNAGDTSISTGVIAQYNTTAPAPSAGNFSNLQIDSAANLKVNVVGGLSPTGTALNTYSVRLTTNTTTTPTASTAYISSITVCVETAGTTSTIDIRDKSGTPIYLVRSLSTGALFTNGEITYNFQTPIKMTSGIDIITTGAAAATVNVFVNYYQ